MAITLCINFSDAQWPTFDLRHAFMHILVTCQNGEDPIKKKVLERPQNFHHYKGMEISSDVQSQLKSTVPAVRGRNWPNFKFMRDFMVVLVTCKNEEDSIENKGANVASTLNTDFPSAQGQLTP